MQFKASSVKSSRFQSVLVVGRLLFWSSESQDSIYQSSNVKRDETTSQQIYHQSNISISCIRTLLLLWFSWVDEHGALSVLRDQTTRSFLLVFSTWRCENVTEKKDHFPRRQPTVRATNQIRRSVAVLRDGGRLKLAAWCQVVMWLRLSDLLEHPAVGFCCWAEAPQRLQTTLLTLRLKLYQFIEEYNV